MVRNLIVLTHTTIEIIYQGRKWRGGNWPDRRVCGGGGTSPPTFWQDRRHRRRRRHAALLRLLLLAPPLLWSHLRPWLKYLKKCFGSPCYLTVVSGGSFFLGGNSDTRRCFLRCLQDSSNSSLLFNIVLWSAVRIISFSVRHRSHALPPLENFLNIKPLRPMCAYFCHLIFQL